MSLNYEGVLQRLKEERVRNNLSQRQLSYQMRMMQSHYSKAELGKKRFTYYEMQCLGSTDIDIQYVYTGVKSTEKYKSFFINCTFEEIICHVSILYSMITFFRQADSTGRWERIYRRIEYMKYILVAGKENDNILYSVRRLLGYTQQKMAGCLGVDVKKLRELENGRILSDSEMIWRIYDLFHIAPSIILKDKKGFVCELCSLLEFIGKDAGEAAFNYLRTGHKCLGEIR